MNRNIFKNLFAPLVLLMGIIILSACGGAKKTAKQPTVSTPVVQPKNYNALYEQSFVFSTFSGKIKMHYEGSGQNQNFTTNLKMQKDQKIWASVIALGITEIARAQITPDRLQAIERIGRNAYDMSFKEGVEKLNAPITFPMLENLLIGNPILTGLKIGKTQVSGSEVTFTMEKDGYEQTLVYDINMQTLIKQNIHSDAKKFDCTINYADYVILKGQRFAKTRNIKIVDNTKNKTVLLDMDFNSYDLDGPIDMQFSIPQSYKMKSL